MKKLIYLLVFVVTGLLSSCHDITVGYLIVDETAGYPLDTMIVITKAENELQRLKNIDASFYLESQEIQDKMEELQDQIYDIQNNSDYWDKLDEAMDDPDFDWFDPDAYDKLVARLDDEYGITPLQTELDELDLNLKNLATEMGFGSLDILRNDIETWQNKVDYKLPYLSSSIDGVLGTDILYFRVINVKSDNSENADKFMDYVKVKGKGQINVKYNPEVPAGTYLLTLEVENEGRSKIIEDVFTVILKDVPEEAPIPIPGE
ncbi:hypothetical protein [Butyricimonas sp.]|uniref:hypothetical protein n=1 Tax=Butyricimonas sp. TaxID=1969738 RepID=UPI0025C54E7F|nr:hypothetical protein [Butyricimonas sp.]